MPSPDPGMIKLNDGAHMPALGLGTYRLKGQEGAKDMARAIDLGWRLLDSAFNYENEGAVGEAIRLACVPREKLFVASKLPGRRHRYAEALATIEESAYRAGLDHFDLYLIHWPNPKIGLYVEAWTALIEARRRGLVRSIGVCNFLPDHIDRLIAETGVVPAVNQIELHPFFPQPEQRAFDRGKAIVTQAWSPLGRGAALDDPAIRFVAMRHGRSVAQVILRWCLQLGVVPLPKATGAARQRENLAILDFQLSADDMAAIAALARPDGRLWNLDPATHEEM